MTIAEQIGAVRRTLYRQLAKQLAQATDRPMRELQLLRSVALGEAQTQAQVAARLLMDPPAVSRLVAKLCDEGLLVQREGKDRRCVCLGVTKKAAKDIAILEAGVAWLDGELKRHLSSAEAKQLRGLLLRLQDGLAGEAAA